MLKLLCAPQKTGATSFMAQQCFHTFCFSLSCPISSRAFLRLRLRLPEGSTPSILHAKPWRAQGFHCGSQAERPADPHQGAGPGCSPSPRVPAITSHPVLPNTGTGFWSRPAAGFCFNIWDLEKILHHHPPPQ